MIDLLENYILRIGVASIVEREGKFVLRYKTNETLKTRYKEEEITEKESKKLQENHDFYKELIEICEKRSKYKTIYCKREIGDSGIEIIINEGRYFLLHDIGKVMRRWRKDEIAPEEVIKIQKSNEDAEKIVAIYRRKAEEQSICHILGRFEIFKNNGCYRAYINLESKLSDEVEIMENDAREAMKGEQNATEVWYRLCMDYIKEHSKRH